MMVLSGLLKSSSETRPRSVSRIKRSPSSTEDGSTPSGGQSTGRDGSQFVFDISQIPSNRSEDPDLRDLNDSLVALAAIFPDVQVEVFREMLSSFDEESRLAVVTEALLKNKLKWVQGRYRVVGKEDTQTEKSKTEDANARGTVPAEDKFRNVSYKQAARSLACHEFKGLSNSTVRAVLAEHNHSYLLARPTLIALNSKSWRFSLSSIFSRSKKTAVQDSEQHPLVSWQSTGRGSIVPTLKSTGNEELDKELFESLVVPLQNKNKLDKEAKDREVALQLNIKEAEDCDALHDCECCFTSYTFEELTACDEGGHFLCFQCIKHAVNEAVFGQGWSRNIDSDIGTLRCIAPMSTECNGCVPRQLLERAFNDQKGGSDILLKLDERLASDDLLKSQLPLIRCPFCSYAENDELYFHSSKNSWQFRQNGPLSIYAIPIVILGLGMVPFLLPIFLLLSLLFMFACSRQSFGDVVIDALYESMTRNRRRKHGLRFTCHNARCGRKSCMSCNKAWTDIHICHESSLLALRTQVELAMSLAIKRTCPRCNTSFVKSSGCNKLTCVCGYQMCYVCRKDIGSGEGYRHFCEHFRPTGNGSCNQCEKCDLYRCEDDEVVVKKAKEEAERRWLEKEGGALDGGEVKKALGGKAMEQGWLNHWTLPDWQNLLDSVVDCVVE